MSIVDGLKNGQVMKSCLQSRLMEEAKKEGIMEALRQMGHADTPVPVMYLHDEEQSSQRCKSAEEIFQGPHGALTETEFFREKSSRYDDDSIPNRRSSSRQQPTVCRRWQGRTSEDEKWRLRKTPELATRYKKCPATDPDRNTSRLSSVHCTQEMEKGTFKSQPETDYTYFVDEQDGHPTLTLKIDGEATLAHFDGKER